MNLFKINPSKLRIFLLYAFLFSLSFENLQLFNLAAFTTSKIIGILYFLSWLLVPKKLIYFPKEIIFPVTTILLLFFWISFTSLVHHSLGIGDIIYDFTLLQSILLFILVSKEITIEPYVQKGMFLSIVLSVSLASLLMLNGVGIQSIKGESFDSVGEVVRIYFFGMNPNDFGALASVALLLCIWLIKRYAKEDKRLYLLLFSIPLIFVAIGYSGSRAAIVTTVLGILMLFLINRDALIKKVKYQIFAIVSLLVIFSFLQDFTILYDRLNSLVSDGDTGDRWRRWVIFLNYIGDYPLFGVDSSPPNGFHRVPEYFNPHNAFLMYGYLGGILGIILSFSFYIALFIKAFKKFLSSGEVVYLVLTIFCFFIVAKSGKGMDFKFVWVVLACVATNSTLTYRSLNQHFLANKSFNS